MKLSAHFSDVLHRIAPLMLGALSANAQVTNDAATMDPVIVRASRSFFTSPLHEVLSESDRVGPYNQPEWTARRAFAETDIYVIPPGQVEFNQFYVSSHPRGGKPGNLFESEFEFGLPWRTQFDVELNYSANSGTGRYDETLIELPHALADWGKIPFNPTINAGWRFITGEADAYFFGVLLAQEFGPRIHFGTDLTFSQQVADERERGYELNAALSYVAIDKKLTLGVELIVEHETEDEESETGALLGPTALLNITDNTYLGLVPLFGLNHEAPLAEVFIVFGMDLEPFTGGAQSAADSDANKTNKLRRRR